jgi:glycosyltransferase involved in cell wall biosynthesis
VSRPLVSVVIPVFNGEAYLAAAIESALAQSYRPAEVIVVDDGSTDGSAMLAARDDVRVLHQSNRGVSAACNAGVEAARGELIAFLDADDLWSPDRLEIQAQHLLQRPELGFVMAHAIQFLEPGVQRPEWLTEDWIVRVGGMEAARSASQRKDVTVPVPQPRTLLTRTEVFRQVGGFNEAMDMGEDLDWLMRAVDAGIRYELLPDVVLHHRLHASNASYRLADSLTMRLRIARDSVRRKARYAEPSISVVIPVRDGERFLDEAIASANAQTYPPLELIVVDDGSSDRSGEIAEQSGARVLRRTHAGVSCARNAGIASARGDLIALLDADDRWPPGRLAAQVDRFRRRPELGFVIGRARLFLHPGTPRPAWFTDDLALGESALALGTLLARRALFERIGGFEESSDICEDLDWLARANDAEIPYEVLDDVVVEYRVHDRNTGLSRRGELEQGVLRAMRSSVKRKRARALPR